MGGDAVKLYYTFVFAPAVAKDEEHGIAAIPAQNKDSLADVLVKFDQHYGVKCFRNVRRQAFPQQTARRWGERHGIHSRPTAPCDRL